MSTILVTGAYGQLGSEIKSLKDDFSMHTILFTDKEELDITSLSAIDAFVNINAIEVIINCAAYTNVDGAEDEIELANLINFKATRNLAEIAKKYSCKLIHVSTDYVFDGDSSIAYVETDKVSPKNVYGESKLKGEKELIKINPSNSIIIRTSWLYSEFGNNFVKTILRLSDEKEELNVVEDQVGSPTYAHDLALSILKIIPQLTNSKVAIYHYANKGKCSWFHFAKEIVNLSNNKCEVKPVSSSQFKSKAKRPKYSLLNTEKIETAFNIDIPQWEVSLKKCILQLNK